MTWHDRAACRGHDTAIFYSGDAEDVAEAKRVCATCGVGPECEAEGRTIDDPGIRNGKINGHTPAGVRRDPTTAQRIIDAMQAAGRPLTGVEIVNLVDSSAFDDKRKRDTISAVTLRLRRRGAITPLGLRPTVTGQRSQLYALANHPNHQQEHTA